MLGLSIDFVFLINKIDKSYERYCKTANEHTGRVDGPTQRTDKNGSPCLCSLFGHGILVRAKWFLYQCQVLFQTIRRRKGTHDEDFPLFRGKESLVEADFKGYKGQAFTDAPSNFSGRVREISSLPLDTNRNRAIFIATLNSLMNYLNLTEKCIHCRNQEPEKCAEQLQEHIKQRYGNVRIGLVGYQPAMVEQLKSTFKIRVLDLNSDNIGQYKYDTLIEDGEQHCKDAVDWADIVLVTGSTIINGTIVNFINLNKPVIFYGTTVAGAAELMGLERICFEGS